MHLRLVFYLYKCDYVYIKYKFLKKFHFPFDADKFQLLSWSISKNCHLYSSNYTIDESIKQYYIILHNIPIIKK